MTPSLPATSDSSASAAAADVPQLVLPEAEWQTRRSTHEQRVAPWIAPRLDRMSRSESHPIEDFLFEYYSYRPGQLLRWHPGIGVALVGAAAEEFLAHPLYRRLADGTVSVSIHALKPQRLQFVRWLATLLEAVRDRPPFFGCAGLHEWAMVHRAEEVRHPRWPLRLGRAGTDAVVESLPIRCSHHDAFRFFTASARPLNRLQPARTDAVRLEQGGCLHANMDLYKWAYKLAPLTPSELVADAFALAREIREVDMRASPYDFSALGLEPIAIETEEGRAAYENLQAGFSRKAAPIRSRLIELCRQALKIAEPEASS
jgi:hypothetical protein